MVFYNKSERLYLKKKIHVYTKLSFLWYLMFLPTNSKKKKSKQKTAAKVKPYLLISTMSLEIIQDLNFFLDLVHVHLQTH